MASRGRVKFAGWRKRAFFLTPLVVLRWFPRVVKWGRKGRMVNENGGADIVEGGGLP
jgi:hypothetical protein